MRVLETERLVLRRLTLDDAEFIFRLVNEPAWLRYIGDKHVRNLDDARDYLRTGPLDMYQRFGFGMFLCELKSTGEAIGSCGLLKRDTLPDPDIGYAFLPEHWGKGYALEAASAVLKYGHREHRLPRILAITSPDNERSIQVLQKCGMHFQRSIEMAERDQVKLFAVEFAG
jgi:RimJ/RimL family protein N-acetyltransferase